MPSFRSCVHLLGQWATFPIAYSAGLMVPLALLGWAFVDAWFWRTIQAVWGITGIAPPHILPNTLDTAWRLFGARMLVLPSLIMLAAFTGVIVSLRLFIGTKRDRSLLSWLLATLLVGVWVGVLLGVLRYQNAQVRYRLSRDMWRFQSVATVITMAGTIPTSAKTEIGEVRCETFDTDRFASGFLTHKKRSIHEDIDKIWTLDDGALLFTINPSRAVLEFHPRGTRPRKYFSIYKMDFRNGGLQSSEELGDGWYLVER